MKIKIKQVDAFTNVPFGGNPAGVVLDSASLDDTLKLKIAKEMNLSETAFVSPSKVADFKVQFFTPKVEVDLCGHATISAFHSLYEEGKLDLRKSKFYQETKAGVLPVELLEINNEKVFMMTQKPPIFEELKLHRRKVASLLGLIEEDLLDTPIMKISTGIWTLVFGIKTLDKLMNAKPDLKAIEDLSREYDLVSIDPFCMETIDDRYNYHLRDIAPIVGIPEDPVCGTGNGCVASYIAYNNLVSFDREISLIGEEGNEVERPGLVYVNITKNDNQITEIKVGGHAVTTLEGEIRLN